MLIDPDIKTIAEVYMGGLCVFREAGGEGSPGKWAVANVIMNRVKHPCWWGDNVIDVVTKHYQFSSFNSNDPNVFKFGSLKDQSFIDSIKCFKDVYTGVVGDNTKGCDSYYDESLDGSPPEYARGESLTYIGNLRLYQLKK